MKEVDSGRSWLVLVQIRRRRQVQKVAALVIEEAVYEDTRTGKRVFRCKVTIIVRHHAQQEVYGEGCKVEGVYKETAEATLFVLVYL